jgi:hypothetical protein
VDPTGKVVGLDFAGTVDGSVGIANPIQFVLDELNVDLYVATTTISTRVPIPCGPLLSKAFICTSSIICTKFGPCGHIPSTKPLPCLPPISQAPSLCTMACPTVTMACPPKSLACGSGFGGRVPPEQGIRSAAGTPSDLYGTSADEMTEDAFWIGYYTALEAVAVAEAERDAES